MIPQYAGLVGVINHFAGLHCGVMIWWKYGGNSMDIRFIWYSINQLELEEQDKSSDMEV